MIKSKIFSKLLSIALCMTILLSQGIILGADAYAEDVSPENIQTQGWDFENNELADWTASGIFPTVENGMVSFASAQDAYLENNAEIDADVFKYLVVKARSSASVNMKFSFIANGGDEYAEADTIQMSASTEDFKGFTEYVFDLSKISEWSGACTRIKLEFDASDADIDIEDIVFYSSYDTGELSNEYHIPVNATEETNLGAKLTLYGTTLGDFGNKTSWDISNLESSGRAMVLWFTDLNIPSDVYNKMVIKLKTNKNVTVSSPFIKTSESGSWITNIPSPILTADGDYTYYVMDLSKVNAYSGFLTEMQFRLELPEGDTGFTAKIADVFVADVFIPSKKPDGYDPDTVDKIGLYTYDEITSDRGTVTLTPYLRYADGRESDDVNLVKWSVSDENIATVNDNGVVTGNNNGTVTVRAAYKFDESVFGEVLIYVSGQTMPYTVTYDKNTTDTVTNMPEPNKWAKIGFTFANVIPERRNYKFLGWALTPDGDTVESVDVTENITVYAKWAEIPPVPTFWSFEKETEGWTADGDAENLRIENGAAVMDVTGGNPNFVSPDMSGGNVVLGDGSDGTLNYIRLRIKNKTNGPATGKILFSTSTHTLNGTNDNVSFSVPNNTNDFVDVYARMTDASEWKGTLNQIRIDGVDGTPTATGGTIVIDEIELMSISNETVIFKKDFDDEAEADALSGISKWDNTISQASDPTNTINKIMKVNVTNRYGNWAVSAKLNKGDKYKFKYKIKRLTDAQLILREVIYGTDNQLLGQRTPGIDWTTNQSVFTVSHDTAKSVGIFSEGTGLGEYLVDNVTLTRFDDFAVCDKSRVKDGATDVDIYDNINILFNETVSAPETGKVHIYDKDNNEISVSGVLADQTTLSVKHDALQSNKEYTLVIDTISDNGGRTAENLSIKFKTKDDIEVSGLKFASVSGNSASVMGTVVNNLNTRQTLILKLWEYNGDTMTALPREYFITAQPGVNNVNHIFENISNNATSISASVWVDNDNIRPVSNSINSKA